MIENAQNIRRSFTRRYVLALMLIAALASASLAVIYVMTSREEGRAELIGLTNGQRALSQRIAFHMLAVADAPNAHERDEMLLELDTSLRAMAWAHERLTGAAASDGGGAEFLKPIQRIYFNPSESFDEEVRRFLDLARSVVEAGRRGDVVSDADLKEVIILARTSIMQTHEVMARILEREARRSVMVAELTQTALWALIIFTIVVEAPLIFAPMGREIERAILRVRAAEAEARAEADRAQAAYEAKSKFLRIMSHELRTPLNAVIGLTDLIDESKDAATVDRYLKHVRDAGAHMLQLVNDVLDTNSVAAGKLALSSKPVDLFGLADGAVALLEEKARAKGLEILLEGERGPKIAIDEGRMRQVLINLVGNAVKFTEAGQVRITVEQRDASEGRSAVEIRIEDTGIGIPADKIDQIFEEYEQIDAAAQSELGSGLGLPITRAILDAMGGTVRAESEVGRGSVFIVGFEAPYADEVVEAAKESVSNRSIANARILVVDDNMTNRLIVKAFLAGAGCIVDEADNGLAAIDKVRRDDAIDLILMDVNMPIMSGDEAAKRIRALGGRYASLPILALTANVLPEDQAALREAGMDDALFKPVKKDALLSTVAAYLHRSQPQADERRFA